MIRYSHVLNLPPSHPFDNHHRWTTFLGKFVMPIAFGKGFEYWFSYYGDFVKFRVHTSELAVLEDIHKKMNDLGLSYRLDKDGKEEEALETLESDLGKPRFLSTERTDLKPNDRALKVLNLLHAGAELFLSTLIRDGDYWREENNKDQNSPFGSCSRSYIHLLHNMAQSAVKVVDYTDQNHQKGLLCEYAFSNAVHLGRIRPIQAQEIRLTV